MLIRGAAAIFVLLIALCGTTSALKCLGSESDITTYPGDRHRHLANTDDIAVQYNDSLEIFCVVEPPYNSNQVKFVQKVSNTLKNNLDAHTHIVNDTTARLLIEKPERQSSIIECELKTRPPKTCFNKVVVDSLPEDVTDFKCRSYNLEKFLCQWRSPVLYAHTDYSLVYYIYDNPVKACTPMLKDNIYNCTLRGSSYRTQEVFYNFTLTSTNRFGNNTQDFNIDHFANLIPGKPYNLVKKDLSAHSVYLTWKIPLDIAHLAKGVTTRIHYQIKTVDNLTTWHLADVYQLNKQSTKRQNYSYLLKDLPYAHWSYDVRIRIKSKPAEDKDEFWSDFLATTFTTTSERPPMPPKTEVGAFMSMKLGMTRDVHVYFQQLDEFYESGDNFTYQVVVTYGKKELTISSNKSSYVNFRASLDAINVSIASSNNEGLSENRSTVYIPPDSELLREPTSFTKTVYGNKTYDLRWHPPQDRNIDSYTVFWCSNTDVERCSGKLQFTTLGPEATSHRVMVSEDDKTYTFAISANRGALSSGMVWGTCTLPAVNATNKVAVFKRGPVGRRTVELQWDLGCSFSEGHVKGYNITYCPREDPSHCNSAHERFMLIDDPQQKVVNVTDLTPHTTYSFHISVVYKDGLGYSSDSVDATTLEDKPSEPLHPMIANVTAHTMRVSWDPPAIKNGIIVEYKVVYYINGDEENAKEAKQHIIVADKSTQLKDTRRELTLTELQAFSNYTVKVQACTTACSDGVIAGQIRTAIGAPSQIDRPTLNVSNLQWSAPTAPGGTLDLYQVEILDSDNELLKSVNTTGLLVQDIPQCDLSDDEQLVLYYRVRAVNFDGEKDHGVKGFSGNVSYVVEAEQWLGDAYEGPWSEPAVLKCGKTTSVVIFWILGIIFVIALITVVVLGSRKIWIRFKTMTDIGPVLPPGLGPIIEEKDSKYQLGGNWNPPGKEEKTFSLGAGDEALLLPPQRRAPDNKDFTSSSDSTDSTTLSLTSKEPCERDAATSDDASDASSIHEHTASPAAAPPQPSGAEGGYVPFVSRPVYGDDEYGRDGDSTSSDDLADPAPPPGYVQTNALPATQRPNIPAGYVIAQDAGFASHLPKIPTSFPPPTPMTKPAVPEEQTLPKLLPMEWKLSSEAATEMRPSGTDCKVPVSAPPSSAKPSSGYVSHTDKVINKHLSILSSHQSEEPALPDPNMDPEAYSRFAWNSEPGVPNNLHSLLQLTPHRAELPTD